MIRLTDVTKVYKTRGHRKVVLDNVSLELDSRLSYAVLGPNGAGKSTLLRIIAGTDLPNAGHVTRIDRISWPLGFAGGFHPEMTGKENAIFVARVYGADIEQVVDFVVDFAEIGSYMDAPVKTYSSGMQARLAFGLSMAIDFDCYLVDEITAVGDARFQLRCAQAFSERRARSGMIMASHAIGTLKEYCDQGIVIKNGKLLLFDRIDDAIWYYKNHY